MTLCVFAAQDHMQSIWIFMEEPETSLSAFYFSIFIQFLIFVSSVLFICDTIQTWRNDETFALVAKVCSRDPMPAAVLVDNSKN